MFTSSRELSLIGASLYVCEGTRVRIVRGNQKIYAVEFTNKDPGVVLTFLMFLRQIIRAKEDRIKVQLFYYRDHNLDQLVSYWSTLLNIPLTRFQKPILLVQKNRKYKPNPLGVVKLRYSHKEHFLKIQAIIEQLFGGVG